MSAMSNIPSFSASDLGASIRRERKALGLTQEALAEKAGCRRATIIEIESGGNVSLYKLMPVLGALGKGLNVVDAHVEADRLSEIFGEEDGDQETRRPHPAG